MQAIIKPVSNVTSSAGCGIRFDAMTDDSLYTASLQGWQSGTLRLPLPTLPGPRSGIARMLLMMQLYTAATSEHKLTCCPVTTLGLIALAATAFNTPGGLLAKDVALSPSWVTERGGDGRLFTSVLVHESFNDLVNNLGNGLPDLLAMEKKVGSGRMALELVSMTWLSGGLCVMSAWLQKAAFGNSHAYLMEGGIGLSSVMYGVKAMMVESRIDESVSEVQKIKTPLEVVWSLYTSWQAAVYLNNLCTPYLNLCKKENFKLPQLFINVINFAKVTGGFRAHMCGGMAGLLQFYVVTPAIQALLHKPHPNQEPSVADKLIACKKQKRRLGAAIKAFLRVGLFTAMYLRTRHSFKQRMLAI